MKTIEQIVIEALEPSFSERIGVERYYFEEYSQMLSELSLNEYWMDLVIDLRDNMGRYYTNSGAYNANCDVASTLECLAPEKYAGKFRY